MRTFPIDHIKISNKETLVFVDLETSGFKPWAFGRIIEFGAIKVSPKKTETFHSLCKPNLKIYDDKPLWISKQIQSLTEIDNKDVADERDSFDVFEDFYEFVDGNVCIAHNARFEKTYIDFYCEYLGLYPLLTFRDTMPMFRAAFGCAKLSTLSESSLAHSAYDDSYQMLKLYKKALDLDKKNYKLCTEVTLPDSAKKSIMECREIKER